MSKAEKTRQFIIEKAAALLNRKGMAGTSISDIMKTTKMTKGGIYGNFENKDEICLEAFNFLSQKQVSTIEAILQDKRTPREKLIAIADFYAAKVRGDNNGGCHILNFGAEADDTSPVVKHRVAEAIKTAQTRISKVVEDGICNGDFSASADPKQFAVRMFTMMEGAILASRVLGSPDQMDVVRYIVQEDIDALKN